MGAVGEALVDTPEHLSNGLFSAWNPRNDQRHSTLDQLEGL